MKNRNLTAWAAAVDTAAKLLKELNIIYLGWWPQTGDIMAAPKGYMSPKDGEHITYAFRPTAENLAEIALDELLPHFTTKVEGIGADAENVALFVTTPKGGTAHITVGHHGRPVHSGDLGFRLFEDYSKGWKKRVIVSIAEYVRNPNGRVDTVKKPSWLNDRVYMEPKAFTASRLIDFRDIASKIKDAYNTHPAYIEAKRQAAEKAAAEEARWQQRQKERAAERAARQAAYLAAEEVKWGPRIPVPTPTELIITEQTCYDDCSQEYVRTGIITIQDHEGNILFPIEGLDYPIGGIEDYTETYLDQECWLYLSTRGNDGERFARALMRRGVTFITK